MDVNLAEVKDHIQKFIYKLIEINDWAFFGCHVAELAPDPPVPSPQVLVTQFTQCFGKHFEDLIEFTTTPTKGPHACGTLKATLKTPIQFFLGNSGIQLYMPPAVEFWYLINRGLLDNAIKLDTFDRLGIVLANGRHRGGRNIILSADRIDLRLSDENEDVLTVNVVS